MYVGEKVKSQSLDWPYNMIIYDKEDKKIELTLFLNAHIISLKLETRKKLVDSNN